MCFQTISIPSMGSHWKESWSFALTHHQSLFVSEKVERDWVKLVRNVREINGRKKERGSLPSLLQMTPSICSSPEWNSQEMTRDKWQLHVKQCFQRNRVVCMWGWSRCKCGGSNRKKSLPLWGSVGIFWSTTPTVRVTRSKDRQHLSSNNRTLTWRNRKSRPSAWLFTWFS